MDYKILVADDDIDNRTIATETLQSSGYIVIQATNGIEAIDLVAREKPNLVLLDLSMPKLDGWQTVKRLKEMPQICDIPVIAFTAHAMVGDDRKAKGAGCDDYLTKPCPPKQILEKVKQWLPTFVLLFLLIAPVSAQDEKSPSKAKDGFIDINAYYDTKNASVMTFNLLANMIHGFQYFSLTNYFSAIDKRTEDLGDVEQFYTEQNLRWAIPGSIPFDLTAQAVLRSGVRNDLLRLGTRWKANNTSFLKNWLKKVNFIYSLNFHILQLDYQKGYQWQMEHVYRWNVFPKVLDERVYLSGFADHNLGENMLPTWVTEHQLGIRVYDNWYAVAEWRRTEFRKGNENSIGLGVEYLIKF